VSRFAILLFVFGLLLEIAGFAASNSENVPFAESLLNPTYSRAASGWKKLEHTFLLGSNDQGFAELSELFMARLQSFNPPRSLSGLRISQINRSGAGLTVRSGTFLGAVPELEVHLSNGQVAPWPIPEAESALASLRSSGVFVVSLVIFLSGVVLQIVGFLWERSQGRSNFSVQWTPRRPR